MSIDDKIEHLYRENKLTEKKGNKPRKNELSYEGFTIESGEYIPANATQTEPMVFCPKCNGMMLPYLDGYKCNDCSYTKEVSEELIKESEKNDVEYVRNPEIKVKPRSRIIFPSSLGSNEISVGISNRLFALFSRSRSFLYSLKKISLS